MFGGLGAGYRGFVQGIIVTRVTIDRVLADARARLVRLAPADALAATRTGARLVDVRTTEQVVDVGRLPDALEVGLNVLEWRLDPTSPSRDPRAPRLDDLVVVVCAQGYSSSLAAARLQDLGFARATDVIGGVEAWRAAGLPLLAVVA